MSGFTCNLCSFSTPRKRSLKSHLAFKHNIGVTWFHCDLCDYRAKQRSDIKKHKAHYHLQDPERKRKHNAKCAVYDSKESSRLKRNERTRKRARTDPNYKVQRSLRSRLKSAVKAQNADKQIHTVEGFGCSTAYMRARIQNQFTDAMTWNNYGVVWNIDHIKPVSMFELELVEEQLLMNHFTNIRPMLTDDNRRKSNRWSRQDEFRYRGMHAFFDFVLQFEGI